MTTKRKTKSTRGPVSRGVVRTASIPEDLADEIDACVTAMANNFSRSRVISMLLSEHAGNVLRDVRSILSRKTA